MGNKIAQYRGNPSRGLLGKNLPEEINLKLIDLLFFSEEIIHAVYKIAELGSNELHLLPL